MNQVNHRARCVAAAGAASARMLAGRGGGLLRAAVGAGWIIAACGGTPPPDEGPAPPLGYRPCPQAEKVGGFKVELAEHFTVVSGSVAAAVVPIAVREVVEETDGCRLLRRRNLHCSPACGADMTCGEGGRCVPYPENLNAGVVTVSGLAREVRMTASPTGAHYWDTTLPHPGFRAEADIRLNAAGGAVGAFALRGWGVGALALPPQEPGLEPDLPFRITWTAGAPGPARIELALEIDQHGTTPATLLCEVGDAGEAVVPARLVSRLIAAGASGYPKARLSRLTADSVVLAPGCVELTVVAAVERSLAVAGHVPCRSDGDCPAGKSCAVRVQTCQ